MTLIKSISGIRGTIGGKQGDGLSPADVVKFASGYAQWLIKRNGDVENKKVVVGRDARISGPMVEQLVCATLTGMGIDVVNIGLATTPTTEIAVPAEGAQGGIIITASHNPAQWNALKLLNEKGEFLSAADGTEVLDFAESGSVEYADVFDLGEVIQKDYTQKHIDDVLALSLVDVDAIKASNFTVAIDCVNSVGGLVLPELLKQLGVSAVKELYCEPNGHFPHNPEPLPENVVELCALIEKEKADVGFVVDPDVDRLAIVTEEGKMFGEEYTLVAVADYILKHTPGNTVSNLSSTRALKDVTVGHGMQYEAAAVGEVNVVTKMKATNAVIGGEGNGGVIYPESHYGRDALVGIALFLTFMAKEKAKVSEIRARYPEYFISKNKIELTPEIDTDEILVKMKERYRNTEVTDIDGVKIDFPEKWVHLRKSNTEPIIRIYSEAKSEADAEELAKEIMSEINAIVEV